MATEKGGLLESLRQRLKERRASGGGNYSQLVRRVATDQTRKSDDPNTIEEVLVAAGVIDSNGDPDLDRFEVDVQSERQRFSYEQLAKHEAKRESVWKKELDAKRGLIQRKASEIAAIEAKYDVEILEADTRTRKANAAFRESKEARQQLEAMNPSVPETETVATS